MPSSPQILGSEFFLLEKISGKGKMFVSLHLNYSRKNGTNRYRLQRVELKGYTLSDPDVVYNAIDRM